MTEKGMESLLSSKFTLGGDASVAAGPVGRQAGASAGTVIVQGRDDLDLMSGTEFTIRASAPR
jgi:lipid-binding SYLF domain-containing protein